MSDLLVIPHNVYSQKGLLHVENSALELYVSFMEIFPAYVYAYNQLAKLRTKQSMQ